MSGWPMVALGEVVEILGGGTPSKKNPLYWGGEIPWASVKDFKSGALSSTQDFVTEDGIINSASRVVPAGNIIVPTRMAVGKVAVNTIDLAINQDLKALFPKININTRYLYHCLQANEETLLRHATGATVQGITLDVLRGLSIPLPPLDEQKRIAAILDKADAVRRQRRQALTLLDTLTQSIFVEMFGDPVSNPKGWEKIELGSLCDVRDGTHDSPKYVQAGYPLLTSKNFSSGHLDEKGAKLISKTDFDAVNKRSKVNVGDVVMPMIGTIGSPVKILEEPNFAIKNVALIKFVDSSISADFFCELFRGRLLDELIRKSSKGGTQKFISLGVLRRALVPVPPVDLQQTFTSKTAEVHKTIHEQSQSESHLDALFASLQSRAFSGDL